MNPLQTPSPFPTTVTDAQEYFPDSEVEYCRKALEQFFKKLSTPELQCLAKALARGEFNGSYFISDHLGTLAEGDLARRLELQVSLGLPDDILAICSHWFFQIISWQRVESSPQTLAQRIKRGDIPPQSKHEALTRRWIRAELARRHPKKKKLL